VFEAASSLPCQFFFQLILISASWHWLTCLLLDCTSLVKVSTMPITLATRSVVSSTYQIVDIYTTYDNSVLASPINVHDVLHVHIELCWWDAAVPASSFNRATAHFREPNFERNSSKDAVWREKDHLGRRNMKCGGVFPYKHPWNGSGWAITSQNKMSNNFETLRDTRRMSITMNMKLGSLFPDSVNKTWVTPLSGEITTTSWQ